jgi:hypothetical protein
VIAAPPVVTPDTTPSEETVAAPLALHAPDGAALATVMVAPTQTPPVVPVIVPGEGIVITLTARTALATPHILVTLYDAIPEPAAMPVTSPPAPIVAVPLL